MALVPSFFTGRRTNIFDPFSLDLWDPLEGFTFPTAASSSSTTGRETSALAHTRVDWKETADAHVFKADLPGLKKEEVRVEVEEGGRVLAISGERTKEQEERADTWHRLERSTGKFLRRFRLPENARMDQVRATMENGVLTVVVPKEDGEKKPDVKAIDISG
ncbi:18.2 kDa class I heat shock protein [Striga asiatica]|uniref:18.2 kDa class I heat shock protein n=1 Tax=Striga asiatica TaxID=4170 RepID=A0A5A7PQS9_STRAF|nr:18.2 kDa class I heat shock protein [Striga asiatica]